MARAKLKAEMKGATDRWTTRADAKQSSQKRRRALDKRTIRPVGGTGQRMVSVRVRCYEQGRFAQVRVVNNPDAPKKARKKKEAAALPPMAEEPVSAYVDETPEGRYPF